MGRNHHSSGVDNRGSPSPLHLRLQVLLPLQRPLGEAQGHRRPGQAAGLPSHRDQGRAEQGLRGQ